MGRTPRQFDAAGTEWMDDAQCGGIHPDALFPAAEEEQKAAAERFCTGCTVQAECLEYAETHHVHDGVWGGLTEDERQQLRKERAQARAGRGAA